VLYQVASQVKDPSLAQRPDMSLGNGSTVFSIDVSERDLCGRMFFFGRSHG
jgi:hypothetical protein